MKGKEGACDVSAPLALLLLLPLLPRLLTTTTTTRRCTRLPPLMLLLLGMMMMALGVSECVALFSLLHTSRERERGEQGSRSVKASEPFLSFFLSHSHAHTHPLFLSLSRVSTKRVSRVYEGLERDAGVVESITDFFPSPSLLLPLLLSFSRSVYSAS